MRRAWLLAGALAACSSGGDHVGGPGDGATTDGSGSTVDAAAECTTRISYGSAWIRGAP